MSGSQRPSATSVASHPPGGRPRAKGGTATQPSALAAHFCLARRCAKRSDRPPRTSHGMYIDRGFRQGLLHLPHLEHTSHPCSHLAGSSPNCGNIQPTCSRKSVRVRLPTDIRLCLLAGHGDSPGWISPARDLHLVTCSNREGGWKHVPSSVRAGPTSCFHLELSQFLLSTLSAVLCNFVENGMLTVLSIIFVVIVHMFFGQKRWLPIKCTRLLMRAERCCAEGGLDKKNRK